MTPSDNSTSPLPATHRALMQDIYGESPTVQEVPTPKPHPGAVVLKVLAAPIISYMRDIYNGNRRYPYPVPLALGNSAIARVAAVPGDATHLKEGMLVVYDSLIRSRDNPGNDVFLHAIYDGNTEGSKKLFRECWRDGVFAEYVRVPLENVFAIDEERVLGKKAEGGLGYKMEDLCPFLGMNVPYGGLRDVGLRAGETVIVAPATGGFGGMAVKVALAMGAGKVIAMGRNEGQLEKVVEEGGGRVVSVKMTGGWEEELTELRKHGEADIFFDISPPQGWDSSHFKAGIMAVRAKGRVSMMGGFLNDVKIPFRKIMHDNLTLKGTWMFTREQILEMVKLMESGMLKLADGDSMACNGSYALEDWKEAFDRAAEVGGNGHVLLKP